MAFGMIDGKIIVYKLDKPKNLINSDAKQSKVEGFETRPIKRLLFSRFDQNLHLIYTTDDNIYCLDNLKERRKIDQNGPGGDLFDLTSKGTIIGAKNGDNQNVYEYDIKKKLNTWNFDGEKHVFYNIKILRN